MANLRDTVVRVNVVLLIFLMVVGCNTQPPPPTPTPPSLADKITIYSWVDDIPQAVLDGFTEEHGIEIEFLTYEDQLEVYDGLLAGNLYDIVVVENGLVSQFISEGLLAQINQENVPNIKNMAISFRDLAHDPGNKYSIPYNWGTTALVVRSDLVEEPVTSWKDLWDPRYAGKVGVWRGEIREVIGLTLKSLGYSVNSEDPDELNEALEALLALKSDLQFIENINDSTSAPALIEGNLVLVHGYAYDVIEGQAENENITYVLPDEGPILWGDNFVIPKNSPNQVAAELFLNFILRPEVSAQITNETGYATPNEAARPLINTEIADNPVVFPPNEDILNGEIILPLSAEAEERYDEIWLQFAGSEE